MGLKEPSAKYLARPRYKQTEAGVIPEEWEEMSFAHAVAAYIDYRGRTPRKLGMSWGGGDILALSANNVQMGRIDADKEAYLGSEELYRKWMVQGECEAGDVVLTMEAPLGNVAQIPDSKKYILSQRVVLIKPKDWLSRDFLAHYMKGFAFQRQLSINSTGSTAKGIQRRKLDELPIGVPPSKVEQDAIAKALSDADALIESLEQLLAKKRHIKQGAMQELLTGKKRLPGFSEEWDVKRLGQILTICHGKSQRGIEATDGIYPVLATGGEIGRANRFLFDKPSVLIGRKGTIDEPQYMETSFWTVDTLFYSIVREPNHAKFIFYCFCLIDWKQYNEASGVPSLNARTIEAIEIKCPKSDEQGAIASTLSDMDVEITALEAKLAKVREIKQAMMQELLTGRIRLVQCETNVVQSPLKAAPVLSPAKSHNWAINEAVVISVLAKNFGSEQWPLGRKRYTKLSYLLHRHVKGQAEGYLKKAAGPYNPATKYQGPERIALKNGYIRRHSRDQFSGFIAAQKIGEAENYFAKWYGNDPLVWLEQFRLKTNDELELLATVDMAMVDLHKANKAEQLTNVKRIIRDHPEWEAKLSRANFSDDRIVSAMKSCQKLFYSEE